MFWILYLVSFLSLLAIVSTRQYSTKELESYQIDPFAKDINLIVELAAKEQFEEAANLALEILQLEPKHFDANQLYGIKVNIPVQNDEFCLYISCLL